jgi:group II intron reverse transcriptase/maturase
MQRAETLLEIIHGRGKRGLPLERLYRHLFNPELYLRAYGKIYRNDGSMTPGVNAETVDGMSLKKIQVIIDALRYERYRWTPVRRVYIDKKGSPGKRRPLGLPTWSDKLLQEVIRSLLEAYYEPQFSEHSHGFRPGKGCHTALAEVSESWRGTTWFIEGDISQCFDRLDHAMLRSILAEDIRDNRFLRLIDGLLQAGYLEEWRYHATLSGAPQGGVLSPLLSNIYLDRLDRYVEKTLLPVYNMGDQRKPYRPYMRMHKAICKMERNGRRKEARPMRRQLQQLPSRDPNDPGFRRLHYIRYADLCRARHKSAYAESRIMPRSTRSALASDCERTGSVGIIRRRAGCDEQPTDRSQPPAGRAGEGLVPQSRHRCAGRPGRSD